jgi:hypothetical protein
MPLPRFLIPALAAIAGVSCAYASHNPLIEAYPGSSSVKVGAALNFHISANVGEVTIEATRIKGHCH